MPGLIFVDIYYLPQIVKVYLKIYTNYTIMTIGKKRELYLLIIHILFF